MHFHSGILSMLHEMPCAKDAVRHVKCEGVYPPAPSFSPFTMSFAAGQGSYKGTWTTHLQVAYGKLSLGGCEGHMCCFSQTMHVCFAVSWGSWLRRACARFSLGSACTLHNQPGTLTCFLGWLRRAQALCTKNRHSVPVVVECEHDHITMPPHAMTSCMPWARSPLGMPLHFHHIKTVPQSSCLFNFPTRKPLDF